MKPITVIKQTPKEIWLLPVLSTNAEDARVEVHNSSDGSKQNFISAEVIEHWEIFTKLQVPAGTLFTTLGTLIVSGLSKDAGGISWIMEDIFGSIFKTEKEKLKVETTEIVIVGGSKTALEFFGYKEEG